MAIDQHKMHMLIHRYRSGATIRQASSHIFCVIFKICAHKKNPRIFRYEDF